jgi:hypothetical protein
VRVRANSRKNVVVILGKLDGPFQSTAVRIASAHRQYRSKARITGTLNYLITIPIVFRSVDMRVRIYESCGRDHDDELGEGKSYSVYVDKLAKFLFLGKESVVTLNQSRGDGIFIDSVSPKGFPSSVGVLRSVAATNVCREETAKNKAFLRSF